MASESPNRKVQPVAAGCVVTMSDFPIVVVSFTCFAAFIIYGASNAGLGAAVPALARALSKSESKIGLIFIFRGSGFLVGTLGSAALMAKSELPLSKEVITCLAAILMGITTFLMACTNDYHIVLALSVFQGLGFGGIDCISNCLFPELWGNRIQPWMQALHLCFGIGAMIGPSLIGATGYVTTYRVLGISAFLPLIALQLYRFVHGSSSTGSSPSSSKAGGATPSEGDRENRTSEDIAGFYKYVSTSVTEDDDEIDMDTTYTPFSLGDKLKEYSEHSTSHTNMLTVANGDAENGNGHGQGSSECDDSAVPASPSESQSMAALQPGADEKKKVYPVTLTLRMLILLFYVVYTGMEAAFGGWIPVYVLREGIATEDSHAAYVSATFWATMTLGRVAAVFTAIVFSATVMLRFHLTFAAICAVMFMWVEAVGTLHYALTVSALLGLALSAIYPLVMTIVIDYGYTMDSYSTTTFMVGATMGEAGLPMVLGFLLEFLGPRSMPWMILVCSIAQAGLYLAVHVLAAQGAAARDEMEIEDSSQGHVHRSAGKADRYSRVGGDITDDDSVEAGGVEMVAL